MITLIQGGDVYAPVPLGTTSVLLLDGKIAKVGHVDPRAVEALGVECQILDASGCIVAPGFIDPHIHLLGGSGESGFATQTPEFFLSEIATFGITSVVGTLGADTTMKTLEGLLAKVKGLEEEGLNAKMWTGGYNVPPKSLLADVREDIMFIDEIIGVGEIAISDKRALEPDVRELAHVATDAYVGGTLARKAGLTHFHVGDGGRRLTKVRQLLEDHYCEPSWFYLTHVERSEALMREAIELASLGVAVDLDVVEGGLAKCLRFYFGNGGDPAQITFSSDAAISSPRNVYEELRSCVLEHGFPLEQVLPLVTSNTARILKWEEKGTLEKGKAGDVVVLRKDTLEIVHVLSRGQFMVRDGRIAKREKFLAESQRFIELLGEERKRGDVLSPPPASDGNGNGNGRRKGGDDAGQDERAYEYQDQG